MPRETGEPGKHKRKNIPRAPRTFTHNFLHALSQKALITLIMCVAASFVAAAAVVVIADDDDDAGDIAAAAGVLLFCLLASGSENKYGKITKISPRSAEDEQPAETKERNTLKCSK